MIPSTILKREISTRNMTSEKDNRCTYMVNYNSVGQKAYGGCKELCHATRGANSDKKIRLQGDHKSFLRREPQCGDFW